MKTKNRTNQVASGKVGIPVVSDAGRTRPALPEQHRWAATIRRSKC